MGKPEDGIYGAAAAVTEAKPTATSCLILTQRETTSEELAVSARVRKALRDLGTLQEIWGLTLHHADHLPFA